MRFSILSTAIAMASVGQAYLDFVAVPKVIGAKQDYNVTIQTSIGQGSRYYYHIAMGVADPSDYDDIHTFGQSGLQIDPRSEFRRHSHSSQEQVKSTEEIEED